MASPTGKTRAAEPLKRPSATSIAQRDIDFKQDTESLDLYRTYVCGFRDKTDPDKGHAPTGTNVQFWMEGLSNDRARLGLVRILAEERIFSASFNWAKFRSLLANIRSPREKGEAVLALLPALVHLATSPQFLIEVLLIDHLDPDEAKQTESEEEGEVEPAWPTDLKRVDGLDTDERRCAILARVLLHVFSHLPAGQQKAVHFPLTSADFPLYQRLIRSSAVWVTHLFPHLLACCTHYDHRHTLSLLDRVESPQYRLTVLRSILEVFPAWTQDMADAVVLQHFFDDKGKAEARRVCLTLGRPVETLAVIERAFDAAALQERARQFDSAFEQRRAYVAEDNDEVPEDERLLREQYGMPHEEAVRLFRGQDTEASSWESLPPDDSREEEALVDPATVPALRRPQKRRPHVTR